MGLTEMGEDDDIWDFRVRCASCGDLMTAGAANIFEGYCHACTAGAALLNRKALDREKEEVERLRHALATITRCGAPGGAILAARGDDHTCPWCRGMYTPCPVSVAEYALGLVGGRR